MKELPPRDDLESGRVEGRTPFSWSQYYSAALDMSLGPLEQARIVLERAIARTSLSWKIVGAITLALPVALVALAAVANGRSVLWALGGAAFLYILLAIFLVFVAWASMGLFFVVRRLWTSVPRKILLLLIPAYILAFLFATFVVNHFIVPALTP